MINFYYSYFKKNYKNKVQQLVNDLRRVHKILGINYKSSNSSFLDNKFRMNLENSLWKDLNLLYSSAYSNREKVNIFNKFLDESKTDNYSGINFVDTFAGCGGLSLGLENAGIKPCFVNEINPVFLESYYFNHSLSISNYFMGDISDLVKNHLPQKVKNADLLVGGPPCQGFSMANRQKLIDDPRNILYKYFLKLGKKTKPKIILMENVRGMMSKISEISDDFKNMLGDDYSVSSMLLNARNYLVPQNRERVFVLATRIKNLSAEDIKNDIVKSSQEDSYVLEDAIYGLPKLGVRSEKNKSMIENNTVGYKIRKRKNTDDNEFLQLISSGKNELILNHTNRYNNPRDVEIFSKLPQGKNSLHESIRDIMPYKSRDAIFKDKYFKLSPDKPCKTITSHMRLDCNMYIHPYQPRGLSPREAARVQTFPDNFMFCGSKNSWYQQIGNAVPVKLAEAIGKSIIKYL